MSRLKHGRVCVLEDVISTTESRRPCLNELNMNVYVSGKNSMSPFCGCYVCRLDCAFSLEEQGKDTVLRRMFWSHSGGLLCVVTHSHRSSPWFTEWLFSFFEVKAVLPVQKKGGANTFYSPRLCKSVCETWPPLDLSSIVVSHWERFIVHFCYLSHLYCSCSTLFHKIFTVVKFRKTPQQLRELHC